MESLVLPACSGVSPVFLRYVEGLGRCHAIAGVRAVAGRTAGVEGPTRGGPHGPGPGVLGWVDQHRSGRDEWPGGDRRHSRAGQRGARLPCRRQEYPTLTSEGARAAAAYGALLAREELVPLSPE